MEQEQTPKLFSLLGGRKMTLTLIAVAVGTAIELCTDRGLSPTFGTFLAGAVASFSAANVVNTVKALGVTSTTETQQAPKVHPEVVSAIQTLKAESDQNKADIEKAVSLIDGIKKLVTASIKAK